MRSRIILLPARSSAALTFVFLLCLLAAFARTSTAASVAIQDASFDNRSLASGGFNNTLTPWQETGGTGNGAGFVERISGFAADGQNHLGMALNHNVWQDLAVTYQPNTRYTLTVAAGNRATHTVATNQSRYLLASSDGAVYATGTFNASTIPAGTFADAPALVFETGASSPALGKPLRVRLEARGSGRSHFDRIRLTAEPLLPPLASTLAATQVTDNSAVLHGTVNARGPLTAVAFEYGPTPGYGSSSPAVPLSVSGTTDAAVATTLDGLAPGTTYNYRVVATSGVGTTRGSNLTFTTETPAYLSALAVSAGSLRPSFAETVTSYAVQVPPSTTAIRLTPGTQAPAATVRVQGVEVASGTASDPIPLATGNTIINVTVTAAGASFAKSYRVTVTRPPETFVLTAASPPPIEAASFDATGLSLGLSLGFAPATGTNLIVVNNSGSAPIMGTFAGLEQGQRVSLPYQEASYKFVVDYFGGTGNDLVLRWAHTKIYGWGYNSSGAYGRGDNLSETVPTAVGPAGILAGKTVTALGLGSDHTLALCADGTLAAWGYGNSGQLGNGATTVSYTPVEVTRTGVLAGKRVVAIAVCGDHNLALCADGTLAAWGNNSDGQLGDGTNTQRTVPVLVSTDGVLAGKTVVAIAAGPSHCLALCSDGTLAAWGSNSAGQLGNGSNTGSKVPVAVDRTGFLARKTVTAITAGAISMALCSDGSVATWGSGWSGNLGNGSSTNSNVPVALNSTGVLAGKTVSAIVSGYNCNLALCTDHTLVAWGYNGMGGLGNGANTDSNVPVVVTRSGVLAGKIPVAIAESFPCYALCSDGTVAAWGDNQRYQFGNGTNTGSNVPVATSLANLGAGERFTGLGTGSTAKHSMAIAAVPLSGNSRLSGLALDGAVLDPVFDGAQTTYTARLAPGGSTVTVRPAAADAAATLTINGTPVESGAVGGPIAATPGGTIAVRVTAENGTSTTYAITLRRDASLASLGLSQGSLLPVFSPLVRDYSVSAGASAANLVVTPVATDPAAAVTVNGTPASGAGVTLPLAYGSNPVAVTVTAPDGTVITYQITVTRAAPLNFTYPSATAVPLTVPAYVATDNTAALSLGFAPATGTHLTVVNNTGTDPITGRFANLDHGQTSILLHNGISYRFVANYFGGDGNDLVLQWATGASYAWGGNSEGQVGDGLTFNHTTPVPLAASSALAGKTIVSLATGQMHSVALCADGTLAAWGDNDNGQLGTGDTQRRTAPARITGAGVLAGRKVVAIAAGDDHTVALCEDGTLAAWGRNAQGQLGNGQVYPSPLPVEVTRKGVLSGKTVTAIAAGAAHSLALCSDGTVVAWGNGSSGRLGNGSTENSIAPVRVDPTGALLGKTVTAIAAGREHSIARCSDGTIVAWGYNNDRQLGDSTTIARLVPVAIPWTGAFAGKNVLKIAAGGSHSLALCSDGTIVAWGSNSLAQLGNGEFTTVPVQVNSTGLLAGKTVTEISAGSDFSLALCSDGTLARWGFDFTYGGGSPYSSAPEAVNLSALGTGEKVVGISKGSTAQHVQIVSALPVSGDSSLAGLGLGTGALGPAFSPATTSYSARVPHGTTSITLVPTASNAYATIEVNGSPLASGATSAPIALSPGNRTLTVKVTSQKGTSTTYSIIVRDDATLSGLTLSAGSLLPGFQADTFSYTAYVPTATAELLLTPTLTDAAATISVNGAPVVSGSPSAPLSLAMGSNPITLRVTALDGTVGTYSVNAIRQVPVTHTFATSSATAVTAAGYTAAGNAANLSLGFAPAAGTSLRVVNNTGVLPIAGMFDNLVHGQRIDLSYNGVSYPFVANYFGGTGNDLVLQWANVRLQSWGNNSSYQLGNGTTNASNVPVETPANGALGPRTILSVVAGHQHGLALCSDGRVAAWGENGDGRLGNNSTTDSGVPVLVNANTALANKTVIMVAAGKDHSLALCSDGTLAAWGANDAGQLGNASTIGNLVPVAVSTSGVLAGRTVVAIAAGDRFSLALCADGTLVTWGNNTSGKLGLGVVSGNSNVPVRVDRSGVLAGKTAVAIAAGSNHCLVLCADGAVVSWGDNAYGQLGNDSLTDSSAPLLVNRSGVLAGKTITAVAASEEFSLALCSDSSIAGWGDGGNGELGTGNFEYQRRLPVLANRTGVLAGKTVTAIDAGLQHALALCTDGTLAAWGYNSNGQLGIGSNSDSLAPALVSPNGLGSGQRRVAAKAGGYHSLALVAMPPQPSATTLAASSVNETSATLGGRVEAAGTTSEVFFEYGTSPGYGIRVQASPATVGGTAAAGVSAAISGLVPGTTYHYRVVASNANGISLGADSTFTSTNLAALSGLTLSEGALDPAFDERTLRYLATVPFAADRITVTPVCALPSSGVTVNGVAAVSAAESQAVALPVGNSTLDVVVTTPDGTKSRTYTVTVTRLPAAFVFNSATDVPVTAGDFAAAGPLPDLVLNHTPVAGSALTLIRNTGYHPIRGAFSNLVQGQTVTLTHAGIAYSYVANYFGGTGNDLVLQWANTRLLAWGGNNNGELGNKSTTGSSIPVPVDMSGVLAGKTVVAVSTGESHSLALCADGTLAAWGYNPDGRLGNGSTTSSSVPVLVDRTGLLAGKSITAISAGSSHSLALCSDGTLAAWGSNWRGVLGNNSTANSSVPVAVDRTGVLAGKTIVSICAGNAHNLVLCADGTLATWGWCNFGQFGNNTTTDSPVPVLVDRTGVLAGKTVVAVSAGGSHSLALCSDGTLAAWGSNSNGQLGNNSETNATGPVLVDRSGVLAGKSVVRIRAGDSFSLALCSDGTLASWGYNFYGRLGNGSTTNTKVPVLVTQSGVLSGKTVIANATGFRSSHGLALCADGTLASWGYNSDGQLGNNNTTNSNVPVLVNSSGLGTGELVTEVGAGLNTSVALVASPPPPTATTTAATALFDAAATLNGSVNANGNSGVTVSFEYGLTNAYGTTVAAVPVGVTGNSATAASATVAGILPGTTYHYRVVATHAQGTIKGDDMTFTTTTLATLSGLALSHGTLAPAFDRSTAAYLATVPFATAEVTVTPVASTPGAVVTVAGITVESGAASRPIPLNVGANPIEIATVVGNNTMTYTVTVTRLPQAFVFDSPADVPLTINDFAAAGPAAEFALNFAPTAGTRLTVVRNTGNLPIHGAFSNLSQWQAVDLIHGGVTYSFVANYHGGTGNDLVLEWANHRAFAWGSNNDGQLGNSTTSASLVPVPVETGGALAGRRLLSVATGTNHCVALCADGTLVAWGDNNYGQLGNGTNTDSSVPVSVDRSGVLAGKTVVAVTTAGIHNLALCSDGTLAAWGYNNYGQLGNGGTESSNVPVLVDRSGVLAGKTIVTMAAGGNHSLALCADGTVAAWGYNNRGQLGNGSTTSYIVVPVALNQSGVLAGKTVTGIAAGDAHSLARCSDGSLAAWGYNNRGQLGDGSTTNRGVPVMVDPTGALAGKTVTRLVAGPSHNLALCADGSLAAWGYNNTGQLGDGSTTNRGVAVAVTQTGVLAGKSVLSLAAGSSHTLAVCSDGTVTAWGSNGNGQFGDGSQTASSVPVLAGSNGWGTGERPVAAAAGSNFSLVMVASPPPPRVTTLAATGIVDTGASLHGSVNAQGTPTAVSFEYGPTPAYGRTLTASPAEATGTSDLGFRATIGGLIPGTTYHYRVLANGSGTPASGQDLTFTTTTLASLSGLATDHGTLVPAFDATLTRYHLTVASTVETIALTPVVANQGATARVGLTAVVSGVASQPLALSVGENRIEVVVTAAGGGNSLTYVLNVVRLPAAFAFATESAVPLTVGGLVATGAPPPFELNFAPLPGTRLTIVNNTGPDPIRGSFDHLVQGQRVQLTYNGIRYPFVVNYFGGTGNDLVLQWANTRLVTWGYNGSGELGTGGTTGSLLPVPVVMEGVLAGKTVVSVATGFASAAALCADGTVAAWGFNGSGTLGDGTGVPSSVPVLVDQTGVLAGKSVVAIASGRAHMLALCSDGSLATWGSNNYGQLGDGSTTERDAPVLVDRSGVLAGKTVTSIAAGTDFCLVLCSDGTLAGWGMNSNGQLGDGSTTARGVPVAVKQTGVLAGKQVLAISAGGAHCLVLCSDGTLVAWGSNSNGEFGNGTTTGSSTPVAVEPAGVLDGRTISTMTAGGGWSMALCTDGTLAAWGYNRDGQLGNGSSTNSSVPVAVDRTGVLGGKAVVAPAQGSRGTSFVLCADGTLAAWGINNYGQFGNGSSTASNVPVPAGVGGLRNGERFMAVAAGTNAANSLVAMPPPPAATTLAADAIADTGAMLRGSVNAQGGTAMVWFEYGLTAAYGKTAAAVPSSVSGETMTAVGTNLAGLLAGTTYHFRVVASGPGGVTRGDDLTFTTSDRATLANLALGGVALSPAFASSVTGYMATVAPSVTAVTLTPQATDATATLTVNGAPHPSATPTAPLALVTGENTITVAVTAADGINTATYTVKVVRLPETFTFDAAGDIPLAVSGLAPGGLPVSLALHYPPAPGTTFTLVDNTGPDPIRGEFAGIAEGQRVLLVHGGITYDFIASYFGGTGNDLVLRWANIRLLGWGSATNGGALGGQVPTPLANDGALAGKSIAAISSGGSHGLARCLDGTVVTWGDNSYGQLGIGSTGSGAVPVAVDRTGVLAGKVVVAAASGGSHDLALCSDGTLVAWGNNQSGQLGAGIYSAISYSPVRVDQRGVLAGKTPVAIAAGGSHNLVLCADGTLATWGAAGTLGNGSSMASTVPVLVDRSGVLAGKSPVAIAAGGGHSLVLCADGSVVAWGSGTAGQLGNGGTANSLTPVPVDASGVLAGRKVISIAAGGSHNLALCADGTLVAWGENNGGQLGDLSTTRRATPVAVNALGPLAGRRVTGISAGGEHSLALCDDGTLLAWGDNGSNVLGTGVNLDSSVPAEVAAGAILPGDRALAVSAGYYFSAALVATPPSPVVESLAADEILDTGATLRGKVNANGTDTALSFEYGLTTDYGTTVTASPALASGLSSTAASATIGGLEPGLTYHYRVVATRPDLVTRSEDRTFTTTTLSALAGLQLSHGALNPAFSMIVREYLATVPDAVASLTVTPVAATSGATLRVAGAVVGSGAASGPIPLVHGENRLEIEVTAPDGAQSRTYAVTVTRLPASFVFDSPNDVPLNIRDLAAEGNVIGFTLNHAPVPGARLTAIRNTGNNPLRGRFSNLGQGELVYLIHDGTSYPYVADYHGGTGNDLVLHWANNRLVAFGNNQTGKLGDGSVANRSVPVPVTDTGILDGKILTDIQSGAGHTVALCSDGTVASWGNNSAGQLGRPGGASSVPVAVDRSGVLADKRVVAIASGGFHVFALCEDGTLVGWGSNGSLQLGSIDAASTSVPVLIPMTGALAGRRVVSIAAGQVHTVALCADGTLAGWGYSGDGQLGTGSNAWVDTPTLVSRSGVLAGKTVTSIAAGQFHSMALCSDGAVAAWGKNDIGQLGSGSASSSPFPVSVDQTGVLAGKSVISIDCGSSNSMALCSDGTLATWGHGTSGSLGNGGLAHSQVPVAVDQSGALAGKMVAGISMGGGHSLAWNSDGTLVTWGNNSSGQLGDGSFTARSVPVPVPATFMQDGERVIAASCGDSHTIALVASPPPPPPRVDVLAATEITGTSVVLNGDVNAMKNFLMLRFEYGEDTSYGSTVAATPGTLAGKLDTAVTGLLAGLKPGTTYHYRVVATSHGWTVASEDMTFTTLSDNARLATLDLSGGILGPDFEEEIGRYFVSVPHDTGGTALTAVTDHPGASFEVNGAPVDSGSPSQPVALVPGSTTITIQVTAEDGITTRTYTVTVTRLPETFAFGSPGDVPMTVDGFSPRGTAANLQLNFAPAPGTILTVVNNTALDFIHGRFSNLAHGQRVWLSHDGVRYPFVANYYGGTGNDLVLQWAGTRVAAWGSNNYGQLGVANDAPRLSPAAVDDTGELADKTILAVVTGYLHSLALCSDGTLASWGYNVQGQLGGNGPANSSVPVAVDTSGALAGKTVVTIAAGSYHNLGLCSDGTIVAWGFNNHGQLGDGTTTTARTPVLVKTDGALAGKQVVAVAAGAYQSYALCSDGTLAAWGYNDEGELGNGGTTGSPVPVAVDASGTLAGRKVAAIAAGLYHTLALCTDGTVVSWGYNQRGQLGNSNTTDSASPIGIGSFGALAGKSVRSISAGAYHSLALCTDGSLAVWGHNSQGQLGVAGINQSTLPVALARPGRPPAGLAAGANHNLLRIPDGGMTAWGSNSSGQLGSNTTQASTVAVDVDTSGLEHGGFIMFAASGSASSHNLAVFAVPVDEPAGLLAWRVENFGDSETGNPLADDNADCDYDGIPNLVEYAFQLDPHQNSAGQVPQPVRIGDRLELRFSRARLASDIEYGAEWSPDLSPGSWRDVPDSGIGGEHVFSLPVDTATSKFMRLRVRSIIAR